MVPAGILWIMVPTGVLWRFGSVGSPLPDLVISYGGRSGGSGTDLDQVERVDLVGNL